MARPKKYSGENFLNDIIALRNKYKRMPTPEFSWAIGQFLAHSFLDWNDVMGEFQSKFDGEFEDSLLEDKPPVKVKRKKTKKIKKK